jgi:hypothetical protein
MLALFSRLARPFLVAAIGVYAFIVLNNLTALG